MRPLVYNERRDAHLPIWRGTGIGFLIGVIPGSAHVISTFVSYAVARRISKRSEGRPPDAILSGIPTGGGRMNGSEGREIYRVVWPRGARTVQASDVAPRLSTLEGKTIGQLWDDLFRGDEIFPILEEELARRFPGVRFVRYDTFGSTHGRDEQQVLADLPGMLSRHAVDAVISGMAC